MKHFLIFFLFSVSLSSFSQVIKGKVVDEQDSPLPGANIYFDGTTIATIADENGNFTINYTSKINSILAVSYVGYQTQYIQNPKTDVVFKVILLESKNILNEVIVKKDRFSRKQKLQLFREQFIGRTANSKNVQIRNEDDIYFEYD